MIILFLIQDIDIQIKLSTGKHDKYVMVWGCFTWTGMESIHIINDTLTSHKYVRILSNHMILSRRKLFENEISIFFNLCDIFNI